MSIFNSKIAASCQARQVQWAADTFTFTITVGAGDKTFALPLAPGYTYSFVIYWGDGNSGTVTAWNDVDASHTYASAGTYTIEMVGECEYFVFDGTGPERLKMTTLEEFTNDMGFKVLRFDGCSNMTDIVMLGSFTDLTTAVYMFNGCTSLTSIPSNLFRYCTNITNFAGAFTGCTGITSIPTDIFRYNTLATSFYSTFAYCDAITSLPTDLFRYNTAVVGGIATGFEGTFAQCTALASTPANLFKYNTLCTNFRSTFLNCDELQQNSTIFYGTGEGDTRFHDQSPDFTQCFKRTSFTGTQGTAPDLWDCDFGTGTPTTTDCWDGAGNSLTSLDNYASIPGAWL